uniref:Uncharacterized protein n=1 Tax=Cacopsylla melanoneura TaxID=428564 RepID=A0A8D9FGC2_9HEMI
MRNHVKPFTKFRVALPLTLPFLSFTLKAIFFTFGNIPAVQIMPMKVSIIKTLHSSNKNISTKVFSENVNKLFDQSDLEDEKHFYQGLFQIYNKFNSLGTYLYLLILNTLNNYEVGIALHKLRIEEFLLLLKF